MWTSLNAIETHKITTDSFIWQFYEYRLLVFLKTAVFVSVLVSKYQLAILTSFFLLFALSVLFSYFWFCSCAEVSSPQSHRITATRDSAAKWHEDRSTKYHYRQCVDLMTTLRLRSGVVDYCHRSCLKSLFLVLKFVFFYRSINQSVSQSVPKSINQSINHILRLKSMHTDCNKT